MRISTYEIVLPLIEQDGKTIKDYVLILNGLYGAADIVTLDDAEKLTGGRIEELSPEVKERLLLRGHLTKKEEEEELYDLRLLARIYKATLGKSNIGLVIMPTYDCNFRCPYCFERHRLSKGQNWLNQIMSRETIVATFSALKDYRAKGYILGSCTLYGGEPLLEKNVSVVRDICLKAKELGLIISAVTNAYDLESYFELLEEFKFERIQLTVDGAYEVNDCRRKHKSGAPSYERLLQNAKLAMNHGVNVDLRVNVGRENLHGIKDLIDDLKARGFLNREQKENQGRFSYYFKATTEDDNPQRAIKESDIMAELLRIGVSVKEAMLLQGQYSLYYEQFRKLLEKKSNPEFSPIFCGSEQGMLVIDPFGRIFSCWDSVAKEEDIVGITDNKTKRFLFNFNKAKWRTRTVDNMSACKNCPYVFICRGGCGSRALCEHGSYFRESCGEVKEIFEFVAPRVACMYWSKKKERELSLSLAEPLSRLSDSDKERLMTSKSQKEIFDISKKVGLLIHNPSYTT